MTVYLDSEFVCHTEDDGTRIEAENEFFDNKCQRFIERYRYIPDGYSWTRSDGVVFEGETIVPSEDYTYSKMAQDQYEEDVESMMPLDEVADLIELIYQDDLEVIG